MTIEIDDTGTGIMVGPAIIGLRRVETNELVFKEIPVELFNEENFKMKKPFFKTVDLIKEGLKELKHGEEEIIHVCPGSYFDKARRYFKEEGIAYENRQIEGELQDALEEKTDNLLINIGFDPKTLEELKPLQKSDKKAYHRYLSKAIRDWVCEDYDNRVKHVKTGHKKGFKRIKEQLNLQ